jgi:hypothetical protein
MIARAVPVPPIVDRKGEIKMRLQVYVLDNQGVELRPAPVDRAWMDATPDRFAYRCLPLNIANAHGWEILCPSAFSARWSGNESADGIAITPDAATRPPALSHFGSGVLTFHVPCLFRTEADFDLMVQGPVNSPKDGIYALSGVIETDWAPYAFTMNWIFTRPDATVRFERGEPFCHVFPVRRGMLEKVKPELHIISEEPNLKDQYEQWQFTRTAFNSDLKRRGTRARDEKWQKLYYRGLNPDGTPNDIKDHHTRVRLKPFVKSIPYSRRGD